MYNRLYKHLKENNILYRKQFGFQEKHSIDHAILQLVHQITWSFEKNLYTLGIFIDLSKAFDTVDLKVLITKLENYGVKGTNLQCFKSYLENCKQFIGYEDFSTSYINISCGVPQGSILGPLLFLVYENDLNKESYVLDSIMFVDDTNLFYSHQNIKTLFGTMNCELQKICEWFRTNKLSLNLTKTNYTLFHKNFIKDKLPLKMPELNIGNSIIKRKSSVKFLGVINNRFINSRFPVSFRGPKLWNEILNKEEKGLECLTLFKKCIRLKLLNMEMNTLIFKKIKTPYNFFI